MNLFRTLLLVSAVGMPAVAFAQASDTDDGARSGGLGEIVVTAQRRSESLQKVPLAVTALDARSLEAKGITNLNNLSTSVAPGVVITQFAGTPSTLAFNIRGAYTSDPGIGLAEQGVAVYADGVPLGRAVGVGVELGDIERIELLRGPQGTLFGRNAEGGAVQFVTKRPTGEAGGRIEMGAGTFGQRRLMGVLELPRFGGLSIKISGLIDKHDGWTRNLDPRQGVDFYTPGFRLPEQSFVQEHGNSFENLGMKDQRGFRIAALFQPTSTFSAYYTYDYSDLDYTVSYNSRTGGRVPSLYGFCSNPSYGAICVNPAAIADNVYYGTPGAQPINPKYADVPLYTPASANHIRGHGLTLEFNASDAITFKSITGLRKLRENGFTNLGTAQVFVQTIPTSDFANNIGQLAGFTGTLAPARIQQKQFSQELQMLGDFNDLKLTAGLFYYREKVNDTRSSFFALAYQVADATTLRPIVLDPLDLGGVGPDGLPASLQNFVGVAHSYAAYAQGTYTPSALLDGRASLTVGIRYTKDKKDFTRVRAAVGAIGSDTSKFRHDRFDPAITLAFQATNDVNLYGRFARAYRAGGTGIRNKLALTTYAPEVNTSFEAGVKTQLLDNRVRFNVAAFHSTIKNAQVSFQNSAVDPSSTDVVNVNGNIKIKGVEVESQVQFTPSLSANLGYSYMDASLGGATVTGPVSDGAGGLITITQELYNAPYLPKHQLNVGLDYVRPAGEAEFFAHAEYSYATAQHNEPRHLENAVEGIRKLSQFSGRLGLRNIPMGIGNTTLSLELFGNNIFNKKDLSYAYAIASPDFTVGMRNDPGGSAYATAPRTVGVQAKVAF